MLQKKITRVATFLLILGALVVTAAEKAVADDAMAEPSKTVFGDFLKEYDIEVESSATLDFYDKYVWRGQYLDTDAVVQPGVSFSAKGLTIGYWASMPMESSDSLLSDESDWYISYAYTYEMVTLSAGHTWYQFPAGGTSSREFSFGLSVDTLLAPSFTFYHDYEDGKDLNTDKSGNYYVLGISHSLPLLAEYGINLDLAAQYGFIDGQWLSGQGSHFTPTASVTIPLTASLSVSPTIGYNVTMGDLNKSSIGNQDSKFFGGVKSSFAF